MTQPAAPAQAPGSRRAVLLLATTELWERFTYYGLRALLVLFMIAPVSAGGFGLPDSRAAAVYGLFAASAYLSALPGGWIADRYLGPVRAIWSGGFFIVGGNTLLMVTVGFAQFAIGLALIAIGVGLLKTSTTALVASAAARESISTDSAFTIFYMAINVGAVLGPLVSATLAVSTGWRGGFGVSAVGMSIGLAAFSRIAPGYRTAANSLRPLDWRLASILLLLGAGIYWLSQHLPAARLLNGMLYVAICAAGLGFGYLFFVSKQSVERQRVGLMLALFCSASIFWAAGEQAAVTLTLLAERYTDRHIFGREFPAPWYQSIYPLYVVIFAPGFVWLWRRLAAIGREPAILWKFGVGLLIAAAGIALAAVTAHAAQSQLVGYGWLIAIYWLLAMGEILVSPVGLAAGTRLAPAGHVGFSTGLWYLSLSLGGLLAGLTGGVFNISTASGLMAAFASVGGALAATGALFLGIGLAGSRVLPQLLSGSSAADARVVDVQSKPTNGRAA